MTWLLIEDFLRTSTTIGDAQKHMLVIRTLLRLLLQRSREKEFTPSWLVYVPLGAGLKKEVIVEVAVTTPALLFLLFGDGLVFLNGGGEAVGFFVGSNMSTVRS